MRKNSSILHRVHRPGLCALALVLCAVLLLAACAPKSDAFLNVFPGGAPAAPGGTSAAPEQPRPRRTIPYSEMTYQRPDADAMKARMSELTQALANAPDYAKVEALNEEFVGLYEMFLSQYMLAYLASCRDVTDEYYQDEMIWLEEQLAEIEYLATNFDRALLESSYTEEIRAEIGGYAFEVLRTSTLFSSEAVVDLQKEHEILYQEYTDMISTRTVTAGDGQAYTIEEIQTGAVPQEYNEMIFTYMRENLEDYAALYARMIELDKQIAAELDFTDPAGMYYQMYGRDYDPDDAKALFALLKEKLAQLAVLSGGYTVAGKVPYDRAFSGMGEAMESMDAEFGEAWNFMLEYGLYDLAPSENKQPYATFNAKLPAWDSSFIFQNYDGSFYSVTAMAHEFGHFYDNWLHYGVPAFGGVDIAEVYSQGMEILLLSQHERFTEETVESKRMILSSTITDGVLYQCALEDFQLRAYELEEVNAAALGQLYGEVMEEYGFGGMFFTDENGTPASWFMVPHFFDSPFYTASYVTSALASLQLWAQAESDWDTALGTYQNLIHADQNQPFTVLLESVGLKGPQSADLAAVLDELAERGTAFFVESEAENLPDAA